VTTLWIIAAVAGAVLLAGVAFLVLKREDDKWDKPRNRQPWNKKPDDSDGGSRLASIPPPAGVPRTQLSEEVSSQHALESQELWIEEDEPTGPVAKILITSAGRTDPGRKREHNEDAYLLSPEHEVYAIADGMGGYAAGEIAAQLAVDTVRDAFAKSDFGGPLEEGFPRRGAELVAAIKRANKRIREEAGKDEKKAGMGTTIVAARFSPGRKRVYIAHVGDSRCYRFRDNQLKQLTTDHTLGAVGIQGPGAGKLSRAVGVFDDVDVDLSIDEPTPGDYYVLCSDGLYKMVPEGTIQTTIERGRSLEDAVVRLVALANERGGRDNVSVVVLRVDEPSFNGRESGEHRIG
jgi:serine/threonine protein phosphatase PrpC